MSMAPVTEIEIEDVGIYRLPNMWQFSRINRIRGPNRAIAPLAFGLGMTIPQFKKLPAEKQREVLAAYHQLTAPPPMQRREEGPRPPRSWERLSRERMMELGRELLAVKKRLPRGHFLPWIEKESGISYHAARRFMRAAKEADR